MSVTTEPNRTESSLQSKLVKEESNQKTRPVKPGQTWSNLIFFGPTTPKSLGVAQRHPWFQTVPYSRQLASIHGYRAARAITHAFLIQQPFCWNMSPQQ